MDQFTESIRHYEKTQAECKAKYGEVFPHLGIRDLEAMMRIAEQQQQQQTGKPNEHERSES